MKTVMKKFAAAVAVAVAFVSAPASAVLVCENDKGQTISWKWGHPRPELGENKFDIRPNRHLSCFVNSYALTMGVANTRLPFLAQSSPDSNAAGQVIFGDDARWAIINLPTMSGVLFYQADWAALPY